MTVAWARDICVSDKWREKGGDGVYVIPSYSNYESIDCPIYL